jgi:transcription-repair coupling factor (superfamily II helicase)
MSIMTTPPRGRYPIKTEIVEVGSEVIRDALLREADRGGQSFFVHNRVESIDAMASYLPARRTSARRRPRADARRGAGA